MLIDELVNCGIEPVLNKQGYKLPGFYDRTVILTKDCDMLVDEYGEEICIVDCLEDILYWNLVCWEPSGWQVPAEEWLPLLICKNLIKKEAITIITYKRVQ